MSPSRFCAILLVSMTLCIIALPAVAYTQAPIAITPTVIIRLAVRDAQAVLEDPTLLPFEKKTRIREAVMAVFDTEEMAKRALGRHWKDYKGRADEFVPLFVALLEKVYLNFGMLDAAKGAEFVFLSERVSDEFAEVYTKVTTKSGKEVPISYRLLRTPNGWKVYDVLIENISMISNYRTQFNKIITTSSFDNLLKKLKEKVEEKEDRQK